MKQPISKSTPISEITKKFPQVVSILADYGLACTHCAFNHLDTVESGAQLHGMSNAEIERLLREINSEIQKTSTK